jgi:hypothetical protein
MNYLEKALFTTDAVRFADALTPFWYTSGTIGPYFINTHFLYGGESEANKLLSFIDSSLNEPFLLVKKLNETVLDFYESNEPYRNIIRIFYDVIKGFPEFIKSEYISGGERRDWFFSPVIAKLSGKKNLFIFKNLDVYSLDEKTADVGGANICHIADLITQASSYERAWIPALKNINGKLIFSASVVDRSQGGREYLSGQSIQSVSAISIDDRFFSMSKDNNIINGEQLALIKQFMKDPFEYGRNFLIKYPDFLKASLHSSDKSIKSKSERCMKENPYKLDFEKIGL